MNSNPALHCTHRSRPQEDAEREAALKRVETREREKQEALERASREREAASRERDRQDAIREQSRLALPPRSSEVHSLSGETDEDEQSLSMQSSVGVTDDEGGMW